MAENDDENRPKSPSKAYSSTDPLVPPIYPAAVYRCESPEQASGLLAGELPGYVYSRDGHPNADMLAQRCGRLHGAERSAVCGSGMAALALSALAQLRQGDTIVVSHQLYGRSQQLLTGELSRFGVHARVVDTCDTDAVAKAMTESVKLLVVETISNPLLRIPDIQSLADIAHGSGALLLVDNTFASPAVCRPLAFGADLVVESLTKIINGHSDVMLGAICGREACWERIPEVLSIWGPTASPFDSWLAYRGIGTMSLRVERASANAMAIAEFLCGAPHVVSVSYPGLPNHPDHELARQQFEGQYGNMVTFNLAGRRDAARSFIAAARSIPFAPSLGDLCTTLSHPESTSHRGLSAAELVELGIDGGTIRLSVGIETAETVIAAVREGLAGLG